MYPSKKARTMSLHPFPRGNRRIAAPSWQDRLEAADTEWDVVQVAKDYMATLDPEQVALLPGSCRPRKLITGNDVSSYAFDLVRYECGDADQAAPFIHRLAAFFSHASIRLSEIMRRTNDEDLDSQQAG
jgi:hypothetical protein